MSSVVISGNTSGSITLSAPDVAGSNTLNLPAATGNILSDTTVGVCRAWVNFDGTGTVAIRASFNVSSITDNGTGDYTVNFTNALSDDNYAVAFAVATNVGTTNAKIRSATNDGDATLKSTTQLRLIVSGASNMFDNTQVCVSIFR